MLASYNHLLARSHGFTASFTFSVEAILALVAGLLILVRPKMLNFIVAAYLIVIGVIGLLHVRW